MSIIYHSVYLLVCIQIFYKKYNELETKPPERHRWYLEKPDASGLATSMTESRARHSTQAQNLRGTQDLINRNKVK